MNQKLGIDNTAKINQNAIVTALDELDEIIMMINLMR